MKILDTLKGYLPIFGRSKIETDVRQQRDTLKKHLLPMLKRITDLLAGAPFSSALAAPVEDAIRRAAGLGGQRNNMASILFGMYSMLPAKLDYIAKIVDEEFEADISRDDMTYKQLQLIRYLELSRFSMEYTYRLLNRFLAAESRTRLNQLDRIDEQLTPAELKWMEANLQAYVDTIALLHVPMVRLRAAIENMPEITVKSVDSDATAITVGAGKLDPLRMNFINSNALNWNPLYHIRLIKAEMEVAHYQLLEKEATSLELRILELKAAYEAREDARLQDSIQKREAQLSRVRAEYHKLTDEYGLS